MVSTALLMIASAYIVRKRQLVFRVDVSREAVALAAGGTDMATAHALVGLENESVPVHRISRINGSQFPQFLQFGPSN